MLAQRALVASEGARLEADLAHVVAIYRPMAVEHALEPGRDLAGRLVLDIGQAPEPEQEEVLALDVGHRYFIAVRALAPTRGLVSPDVSSDGGVVTLNTNVGSGGSGPLPGSNVYLTGRSCVYACSAAGTRGPFAGHAAAFLMVAFLARRRRANRLPLGG